ncbi:MAG: RpiB/LacA/LacB family sugar-phosphate isomerase [Candidatus Woesearchaeota archaeon]
MKFKLASDHAGREIKKRVLKVLEEKGLDFEDLSPENISSDDYPDFASKVCSSLNGDEFGFLACGTGIGISIAANKFQGIRAALVTNPEDSKLSRAHNNANVLVLGQNKSYSDKELEEIIDNFVNTSFEKGRHERRVGKLK